MKKRTVAFICVLSLTFACIAGCGSKKDQAGQSSPAVEDIKTGAEAGSKAGNEPESKAGNEAGNQVSIANPWVDITEEQARETCLRLFKAPDGAANPFWQMCEPLADPDNGVYPLVQLKFELDGNEFTARAQQGAGEDDDISGIYADWTVGPDDVTLANWGGGNMAGKTYRSISDEGYTDLITWYDVEIGIKYSLSVSAPDLDGFDIQAIAEQMYSPENET